MRRSVLNSMLLVAVVLLAGCNFLGLGPSIDNSEIEVTPADVPIDTPTVTPRGQIAPGVFPEGVYNASALASAHARTLGKTSFTIRTNVTYRYSNGTLARWTTGIMRIDSGPPPRILAHSRDHIHRLYTRHRNHSTILARDLWYGADHGYWRITYVNNTTGYHAIPERIRSSDLYQLTRAWMINRTLSDVNTQVNRLTRNGSTYYRIEGPVSRNHSLFPSNNQQNASQWLLIDSRGVIYEYHIITHITGPAEKPLRRHYSITFREIGTTTVEKPAWIEIARNRTEPANRTTTVG
jgi:hypothetical protein